MSEISVSLQNVEKWHGKTIGVDRVSLEVYSGEFFSILGPSGSGKTSTLRLIAGLDHPDRGEIQIQGRAMKNLPPNRRPVNMVFQNYALFPHLNVFDNVAFGLQMQGHPLSEIRVRVPKMLELVKLQRMQSRLPAQLSGGEQQRVALARALVNHPAVLLLDEPLGALDQQLRQEMQVELKQIQEQVQCTFVCVTHHQEEALMLSDRVAVMNKGRVLQIGTPQEIYDSPESTFVAKFIGLSNSLTGQMTDHDETTCTVRYPKLSPIRAKRPMDMGAQGHVTMVVRPERLHISSDPDRNGFENSLPAQIKKATFNGNEILYQLHLTPDLVWTARVSLSSQPSDHFQAGQHVYVQWHADQSLVLPA